MAPPSITKPFSIRGSTTRMNGGANGKFSGKTRCSRMCGTPNSAISSARALSGSTWCSRTCHSNRLSFTRSTVKIGSGRVLCFCISRYSFMRRRARIVVSIALGICT
uniref:Uncharacterized protein n=1 Tax=Lutzomyia longipalpis TaxID=7200 RepID=A0A7G3B6J4_LUTLO